MTQYTAKAVWDEHVWFVQCDQVPGAISTVSRLAAAVEHQREAISFAADVPIDQVEVEVRYELPAKSKVATYVKSALTSKARAEAAQEKASRASRQAVQVLLDAGMSTRDAAKILGVSQPRVSQLSQKVS